MHFRDKMSAPPLTVRLRKNLWAYCFAFFVTLFQQLLILPFAGAFLDSHSATKFINYYGLGQLGAAFEFGIGVAVANAAVLAANQSQDATKPLFAAWTRIGVSTCFAVAIPMAALAVILPAAKGGGFALAIVVVLLNFISATLTATIVGICRSADNQAYGVRCTNAGRLMEAILYALLICYNTPVWAMVVMPPLIRFVFLWGLIRHLLGRVQVPLSAVYGVFAIIRSNIFDRGLLLLSNWIQFTAPVLLLNLLDGPQVAAGFAAARAISRLAWQPSIILRSAIATECAKLLGRRSWDEAKRVIALNERRGVWVAVFICLSLIAALEILRVIPQSVLVPQKYLAASRLAGLAAAIYVISPLWLLKAGCLEDLNETKGYAALSLLSALFVLLLVTISSLAGAPQWALFANAGFELCMFWYVARKFHGMRTQ
jgi:hypothetical protein